MTLSLLGAAGGEVGIVIASSSPAVAARCAFVRAGVGAAASQNVTDPRLGPALLDALGEGPDAAVAAVRAGAEHVEHRQLAVLDAAGRGAVWSGARTLGVHGGVVGDGCVAAGNLLASEAVPATAADAFAKVSGSLPERLLEGLRAGAAAGGEAGPLHSAGLLVAGAVPWPEVDLRVDWSEDPVADLLALWAVYAPQRADYVRRALDPDAAPAYGVPGE
jgi:uncharacterized Ntn-hydrolase superfamily protein